MGVGTTRTDATDVPPAYECESQIEEEAQPTTVKPLSSGEMFRGGMINPKPSLKLRSSMMVNNGP